MNLLFIIPGLGGGGAERVTVTLASKFCKKHNVIIVTYYDVDYAYDFDESIDVICLKKSNGGNTIGKIKNFVARVRSLKTIKRRLKIDCTISMLFSPNLENVLSRQSDKVIVSIRNKCSEQLSGMRYKLNAYTCQKSDLVVALSQNVMKDQIENFNTPEQKIVTIYNPCDIDRIKLKSVVKINDEKFERIRKNSDFMVITAGRLLEQKGQWHLIRAFSEIVKEKKNASLVILGQGELEQYLEKLIEGLNLQDNVYLLGFHSNPYPYLYQADLFAFTSLYEGFGNVLLEAMACGLPIVSCDCDAGPRELLAPETDRSTFTQNIEYARYGILTPVMDGKKYTVDDTLTTSEILFAEAIEAVEKNRKLLLHYKEMSSKRIQDFSLDSIATIWEKYLE